MLNDTLVSTINAVLVEKNGQIWEVGVAKKKFA